MITILLEQIIQLLKGWIEKFNDHAEAVENSLTALNNTASDIETNTDPIPDIRDNTGAIITPITTMQTTVTSIKNSVTTMKDYTYQIRNNTNSITTSAGAAAAFAEDCATNTLNILNKVTTIASDTTQIRTDSDNMVTEQSKIYDAVKWLLSDKYIETTESGASPFEFETDVADDLISCNVGIVATQSGSGDPSPDNVRPITGYSDMNLTVNGNSIQISLGQTVYNGIMDRISGKLIVYSKSFILSDKSWYYNSQYGYMYTSTISDMKATSNTDIAQFLNSDCYNAGTAQQAGSGAVNNTIAVSSKTLRIRDDRYTDSASFISAMGNTQIIYPLAEPSVIHLTPQQIAAINGVNTIVTDTNGNIEVTYKESIKNYLDKQQ